MATYKLKPVWGLFDESTGAFAGFRADDATGTKDYLAALSAANAASLSLSGIPISGSSGSFTTLAASSTVSGVGFSNYMAAPPSIGTTTPGIVKTSNLQATYTDSSGTAGNATNNSPTGRAAFAAAATTCVITNSLVTATSKVFTQLEGSDTTLLYIKSAVPAAGSFTVTGNAAATAATKFSFIVVN
jgi:hypothetical protein